MKRPGSPRRSTSLKRTAMKRWRKPKRTDVDRATSRAWAEAVTKLALHGGILYSTTDTTSAYVTGLYVRHHPVPRQVCRKHGAPEWDARNGMPVSTRRHERHHARLEPILRHELPPAVFAFAAEYGLEAWLDRHYPEMCPDCGKPVSSHELYRDARCPVVVVRLPAT